MVGRQGFQDDVKQDQEDQGGIAIAGMPFPEHSVENVVEHAGKDIEGDQGDPHEDHQPGHDHGEERSHVGLRRSLGPPFCENETRSSIGYESDPIIVR